MTLTVTLTAVFLALAALYLAGCIFFGNDM